MATAGYMTYFDVEDLAFGGVSRRWLHYYAENRS